MRQDSLDHSIIQVHFLIPPLFFKNLLFNPLSVRRVHAGLLREFWVN